MDCEFFKESYYYSQPGPQGESVGHDLSWLTYPIRRDPPEQVGNTADTATDHIVSSSQITPNLSDEHPSEPELTPEPVLFVDDIPSTVSTDEILSDDVRLTDDVLSDMPNVEISNRYELPLRSTRGILPRKYDIETKPQRSRYPVNRVNID